jgi:hypothetical protein
MDGCRGEKYKHVHIEYYGVCRDMPVSMSVSAVLGVGCGFLKIIWKKNCDIIYEIF